MTGPSDGKTAIVTGAGSGIGAAIATELAEENQLPTGELDLTTD